MSKARNLADVNIGETVIIRGFSADCGKYSVSRLKSLGFNPSESITPILISPLGDPSAYLLGSGAQIALRRNEAEYILIE